ncbi:nucleoporin interacting component family protein [Galdieria sulphuraria]|uniref:Nuclear pore protein n=1 Tax=Galdieria sulphuraria TaxID=130081 RepID=M2VU83_GALSU|nr:nucleoporin interacting component family protein [Galdieria sulphuraria]EME26751.1 nucleoporin interacting component family protein [Galdieria sulphuraria]|eukprot:XP_005703271.1 nucleoporin interacting component family protein [Galdieria sulphuraria]
MTETNFAELLQKSLFLASRAEGTQRKQALDNTPLLPRGISQVDKEAKEMLARASRTGGTPEIDPSSIRLFSELNFDAESLGKEVRTFNAVENLLPPPETSLSSDLDSYILEQHEDAIFSTLEDSQAVVSEELRRKLDSAIETMWEKEKDKFLKQLSRHVSASFSESKDSTSNATSASLWSTPLDQTRTTPSSHSSTILGEHKEYTEGVDLSAEFTNIVRNILERRVLDPVAQKLGFSSLSNNLEDSKVSSSSSLPIAQQFAKAISSHQHALKYFAFIFEAISWICGERHVDFDGSYIRDSHLKEGCVDLLDSTQLKRSLQGSLRAMEEKFKEGRLVATIRSHPEQALRGGKPGLVEDIRAYLRVVFHNDFHSLAEDTQFLHRLPLWPQIFLALRCGDVHSAVKIAEEANAQLTANGLHFYEFIQEFFSNPDRCLSEDSLVQLSQEYSLVARRSSDAFLRVCYILIARCNPNIDEKWKLQESDYSIVLSSIEDYLWFHLSLVRLDEKQMPLSLQAYRLQLIDVQQEIQEFGASYFDPKGERPLFYTMILTLSLQFAKAVDYLVKCDGFLFYGLHIGLILYYYGILHNEKEWKSIIGNHPNLSNQYRKQIQVLLEPYDFDRCLWSYVQSIAKSRPLDAACYLYILRDTSSRMYYLKELILQSGEYESLLGFIGPDGARRRGFIDQLERCLPEEDRNVQVSLVLATDSAIEAAERGDIQAAVRLYDIAEEYDRLVAILAKTLSAELIHSRSSLRSWLVEESRRYLKLLSEKFISETNTSKWISTLKLLLSLVEFIDLVQQQKYEEAWTCICNLNILPTNERDVVAKSSQWQSVSDESDQLVAEKLSQVIVRAMDCLVALYQRTKESQRHSERSQLSPSTLSSHKLKENTESRY